MVLMGRLEQQIVLELLTITKRRCWAKSVTHITLPAMTTIGKGHWEKVWCGCIGREKEQMFWGGWSQQEAMWWTIMIPSSSGHDEILNFRCKNRLVPNSLLCICMVFGSPLGASKISKCAKHRTKHSLQMFCTSLEIVRPRSEKLTNRGHFRKLNEYSMATKWPIHW